MNKFRRLLCLAALCGLGLTSTTITHAQSRENRFVRVINRASSSIRYFYASNVDRGTWEEDILGAWRVIGPNRYLDVNIDDGTGHCLYDLRAVLLDGREAVTRGVNVCQQESWTVTDGN